MLKAEDVQIELLRTSDGHGAIIVRHLPTGVTRGGSLENTTAAQLSRQFLAEIETELLRRGEREHVLPLTVTHRLTRRADKRRLRHRERD